MRRLSVLFTCLSLVISLSLLVACGGTSSNSGNNAGNSPASPPNAGAGSGSAGSGSGSGGSDSSGSGSASGSSFVSYAYTAGTNEIRGYAVNSNGSLTAVSGSPYAVSNPKFASTKIVTNGANLYATADAGTNLDILSINKSSGSLAVANTTSVLTGDPNHLDSASALALDHTGASLYAIVGVSDFDSGVNVFTVGSSPSAQQIQYLPGTAIAPSSLVFSPNNQFAYSNNCSIRVSGLFEYERASDGTVKTNNLGPVPGPIVTGVGFCPEGLAASAKGYLAVVWIPVAFGSSIPSNQPYVMTYTINSDGTLAAVSNSQIQTASTSASKVAMDFDPTGSFLVVAGDAGVQTYALNSDGTLAPVASPQAGDVKFQNVAWDKSSHVFATSDNQLYVFNASSGALAPVSGSPYAGDSELAVLPLQ
jgi:hypothetical protein